MDKKEILEALNFRHACKEFDPSKKISEDELNIILESARLSPSSMGIEPCKFLIIENEELKKELASVSWGGQKQVPSCSHLVIALSRTSNQIKYNSDFINYLLKDVHHMPEEVSEKYKEIMKGFEESKLKTEEDLLDYSTKQTYIACANLMTIAAFEKIDSCPIGGFDLDAVNKILVKRNLLDEEKFYVTLMVALGYRKNPHPIKTRQPFKDIFVLVK